MHEPYFEEARKIACKATCNRAHCGAIIVSKEGKIVGRGYNAPPLGDEAQRMCDESFDTSKKPKSDKTCCVHAEWNAIIDALKHFGSEVEGATLYFMRVDATGAMTNAGDPYCTVCSRLALQSGVASFGLWNDGPEVINARDYNVRSYDFAR